MRVALPPFPTFVRNVDRTWLKGWREQEIERCVGAEADPLSVQKPCKPAAKGNSILMAFEISTCLSVYAMEMANVIEQRWAAVLSHTDILAG
jgi:hypothetical protein